MKRNNFSVHRNTGLSLHFLANILLQHLGRFIFYQKKHEVLVPFSIAMYSKTGCLLGVVSLKNEKEN